MKCCEYCFTDNYIQEIIQKNGRIGNCNFCGKKNVYCIKPEKLKQYFSPIIKLYTRVNEFIPTEIIEEMKDGKFIGELLCDDWEIFDNYDIAKEILNEMFICTWGNSGEEPELYLDSWYENEERYWGTEKNISSLLINEWDKFCNEIKFNNRFFPKNPLDTYIFKDLVQYFSKTLKPPQTFFRARISKEEYEFSISDMGKPTPQQSVNGRINPIGIPCLYLASTPETSIYEIRPNIYDYVTVGEFTLKTDLYVLDLRSPIITSPFKFGADIEYILLHLDFLRTLSSELSKPVHPHKGSLDYIATQYLSEYIKSLEYQGILYSSNFTDGYNLAIFDDKGKLTCEKTTSYQITNIDTKYTYNRIVSLKGKASISFRTSCKLTEQRENEDFNS